MSCCTEVVDIGCVNFCSLISLGFNATETGLHSLEIQLGNGGIQTLPAAYVLGTDMEIASNLLAENKVNDIKILMPSGTYFQFATGVDCVRLTTQVHV